MNGFTLDITLTDDTIFSQRAGSEGGHATLDYIPGSALLGAAANQLYDSLDEQAWNVFHSGQVRFGNGYPLAGEQETFPMPMSLHKAKEKPEKEATNFLVGKRRIEDGEKTLQSEQMREGYLSLEGKRIKLDPRLRMKTAIDPETGRAKDGALFGYAAIPAGTRFRAHVEVDESLDPAVIQQLRDSFSRGLYLGRSRAAEYGRARVDIKPLQTASAENGQVERHLVLWCLSDLACIDQHGMPTTTPAPTSLGLPEGHLDLESSFIRNRRYTPWNGKRQGYDLERLVIGKGSVLVFELESTPDAEQLSRLQRGIGLYTAQGLGRVWANPPLLSQRRLEIVTQDDTKNMQAIARPASPLLDWIERRQQQSCNLQAIETQVEKWLEIFDGHYTSARNWAGLKPGEAIGPSASQWGQVMEYARQHTDLASLFDAQDGPCKPSMPGWQDALGTGDTFAAALKKLVDNGDTTTRGLQALARRMQDHLKDMAKPQEHNA